MGKFWHDEYLACHGPFNQLEVVRIIFVLHGVTSGLPLENGKPCGVVPHAYRPVLAVFKDPDIAFSPFPCGVFCSILTIL